MGAGNATRYSKRRPVVTVVAVSHNSESSHTFANGVRAFTIRANDAPVDVRVSWKSGEVNDDAGDWMLIRWGENYWEEDITVNDGTRIYLRIDSATASKDVAVLEWS